MKTEKGIPLWRLAFPLLGVQTPIQIRAHTKSDARGIAKTELGIPRKGRIPAGFTFERVTGAERNA